MPRIPRTLVLSLCLVSGLAAQGVPGNDGVALPVPAQQAERHGLPGRIPGTERWIVHFRTRSFTLDAFRKAIYAGRPDAEVQAIIRDMEARVKKDQAAFEAKVRSLGGEVVVQWWLINACAIDIPFAKLGEIRDFAGVTRVEPDEEWEPLIKTATNSLNHNADAVQAKGIKGTGVATAIVDTGQDSNMNNSGRPHRTYFRNGNINNKTGGGIGGSRLLANIKVGLMSPDDVHGHGTGVASIAAGANWGTTAADHGHAYDAGIVGFSIANNVRGSSSTTTITSAWQQVAANRTKYNIVSANNSYSGSPDPLNAAQKALDSAAYNADIMICVAGGNSGPSTRGSQSAANGLAVAAVYPNTHRVASFSSRGPLYLDSQRYYPDIAACGVSTVMARRNLETSNYIASGTSMASPQVCGAATLIRGAVKTLKADETKAILLASALDISAKNPKSPYNSRNAYGMGLLRDDAALAIARSSLAHRRGSVTSTKRTWTWPMPVVAGKFYAVAIAWHRTVMTSKSWSNLDLEILDGTTVVGSSKTPRNLYEVAKFRARRTGGYVIRVTATTLQGSTQPFGMAFTQAAAAPIPGTYATFGLGCKGTGKGGGGPVCASLNQTSPTLNSRVGLASNRIFAMRVKAPTNMSVTGFQIYCQYTSAVTLPTYIYASSGTKPATTPARTSSMKVSTTPGWATTVFTSPYNVSAGTTFYIAYRSPSVGYRFRPIVTTGVKGTHFWNGPSWSGPWTTQFWKWRVNCSSSTGGAIPVLSATGVPEIGKPWTAKLSFARPSTVALLFTGFSNTKWGAIPLPFDMSVLGAKGCKLLTSGDIILPKPVLSSGAASGTLPFPNLKVLVGVRFWQQWLVVDKPANNFGMVVTNGGAGKVGGQP